MTHSKKDQLNIRPLTKHAGYPKRAWLLVFVLLITFMGMPGLGANPVFALPPEPIDPDPVGGNEPVTPPEVAEERREHDAQRRQAVGNREPIGTARR